MHHPTVWSSTNIRSEELCTSARNRRSRLREGGRLLPLDQRAAQGAVRKDDADGHQDGQPVDRRHRYQRRRPTEATSTWPVPRHASVQPTMTRSDDVPAATSVSWPMRTSPMPSAGPQPVA